MTTDISQLAARLATLAAFSSGSVFPATHLGCNRCDLGGVALSARSCPRCGATGARKLEPYAVLTCEVHDFPEMSDGGYCIHRGHDPDNDDWEIYVAAGVPVCRGCGCTDAYACPGGCGWAGPGICTTCAGRLTAEHLQQLIDGAPA